MMFKFKILVAFIILSFLSCERIWNNQEDNNNDLVKIHTVDVTDVNGNSAICGGYILNSADLNVYEKGLCWDNNSNPTIEKNKISVSENVYNFSLVLSNLNISTQYYVKAYAINALGIAYGEEKTFTTTNGLPEGLVTQNVTDISFNAGSSGGSITGDGGFAIIDKGIYWSTNSNPSEYVNKISAGSGLENYIVNLSGLNKLTTYYVRAYATNEKGTAYGEEIAFTTKGLLVDYDGNQYGTVIIGSRSGWLKI